MSLSASTSSALFAWIWSKRFWRPFGTKFFYPLDMGHNPNKHREKTPSTRVQSRVRTLIRGNDFARFMTKFRRSPSGCWLWTRHLLPIGYAQFFHAGKVDYAHRFSFLHFKGAIPDGCEIDHTCRVRHCVNPDHLRAVTHRENQILAAKARKHLFKTPAPHIATRQSELFAA